MSLVSVTTWSNTSEGEGVQKNDIALKSARLGQKQLPNA